VNSVVSLSQGSVGVPIIEAYLFAERDKRTITHISAKTGHSESEVRRFLVALEERYESPESGLELHWVGESVEILPPSTSTFKVFMLMQNTLTKGQRNL